MAIPKTKALSYAKNVGKSISYSVIDQIKESNPVITGFVNTNKDTIKSVYNAIAHVDKTYGSITQELMDSKYGELGAHALQYVKEDLRTGKWYNLERKKKTDDAAMEASGWGEDDDDFGFEAMANGDYPFGEDDDESLESMVDLVGQKSSKAISEAIVQSTEQSINVQANLAKASADQQQAIYANLHAGMGTINENIGKLIEIANGPMTTHMENSKTFYESESSLSKERNDILKGILDIQKSIYRREEKAQNSKITMYSIMDENGMPDLDLYFERVMKNINDNSGGMMDMVKEYVENGSFDSIIASPLEFLTGSIAKVLIPKTIDSAMKQFNKSIGGLFGSAMSKLMNSDSDNSIITAIKNIFGVEDSVKSNINVGKYEKGAVPFDGITRKSIIEVIPTYLARIESAVMHMSGVSADVLRKNERRYNYDTGKYVNTKDIRKSFRSIKNIEKQSANRDINKYFEKFMDVIDFGDNKKRKKQLKKNFNKIMDQSFESGVLFNPKEIDKFAMSDYGLEGDNADEDLEFIRKVFERIPKDVLLNYANNVYSAKNSITNEMNRREASGHDIISALFNDSLGPVRGRGKSKRKKKASSSPKKSNANKSNNGKKDNKSNKDDNSSEDDSDDGDGDPYNWHYNINNLNREQREFILNRRYDNRNDLSKEMAADLFLGNIPVYVDGKKFNLQELLDSDKNTLSEYLREISNNATDIQDSNNNSKKKNKNGKKNNDDENKETASNLREGLNNLIGRNNDDDNDTIQKIVFDPDTDMETLTLEIIDILNEQEEKEKSKNKKKKSKLREKLDEAAKSSSGIAKLVTNVEKLIKKPTDFLAGLIKKADTAVYELIFGVEYDEDGERKSVAKAIFDGLREQFEEFRDWTKRLFKPVRDYFNKEGTLGNKIKKGVKSQIDKAGDSEFVQTFRDAFGFTKKTVKDAASTVKNTVESELAEDKDKLDRTNSLINQINENDKKEENSEKKKDNGTGEIENAASGMKRVKKTGVIAVSEGEMIVPPDLNPYNIKKRLANENKAKKKFADSLANRISNFGSGGTVGFDPKSIKTIVNEQGEITTKSGIVVPRPIIERNENEQDKEDKEQKKVQEKEDKERKKEQEKMIKEGKQRANDEIASSYIRQFTKNFDSALDKFENLDPERKEKVLDALKGAKAKELVNILKQNKMQNVFHSNFEKIKDSVSNAVKRGKELINEDKEQKDEDSQKNLLNKVLNGKMNKEQEQMVNTAMGDIKSHLPQVAAGATIGGGLSFLTGAVGGPLVGAAVGSGIALIKNSEAVSRMLFGDKLTDENGNVIGRKGNGLLSKELTNNIHKYAPGMGKGAILGAVTSLLPITPFGPLTGAFLGSAIGFATSNERVRESLFGDEGFLGKDSDKKIKKALPNIGAGAAASLLFGPFGGPIPNLILGSAAGFATSTDKFKDVLFGKVGDDGNRHGGIIETAVHGLFKPISDFTKNTIADLVKWADKNIKQPLKDAIKPIKKQIKLMFEGIYKGINSLFKESLGATLDDMIKDYIFKPITGFIKKTTGLMLKPIKAIVSSPFKLIGAIGNKLRDRQVKRGQADYMAADERLAYREKRGLSKSSSIMPWNVARTERFKKYDEALSEMKGTDAKDLSEQLGLALDSKKELEKSTKSAYGKYTKKVRKNKKLSAKNVNDIAKKIQKFAEKGGTQDDANRAVVLARKEVDKIDGLSPQERKELYDAIDEYVGSMQGFHNRKNEYGGNIEKIKQQLLNTDEFKNAGIKNIDNKDLPKLYQYLITEGKAKSALDTEDDKENKTDEAVKDINEAQQERHNKIVEELEKINDSIQGLIHPDALTDKANAERLQMHASEEYTVTVGDKIREGKEKVSETAKNIVNSGKDAIKSAGSAVKDSGAYKSAVNTKNEIFGDKDKDYHLTEKGVLVPKHAAAGRKFNKNSLAAVSEGEIIISPDDIPNFAGGGVPGGGTISDEALNSIHIFIEDISKTVYDKLVEITEGGDIHDTLLSKIADGAASLVEEIPIIGKVAENAAEMVTHSSVNREMADQGGTLKWMKNKFTGGGDDDDDEDWRPGRRRYGNAASGKEITKSGLIAASEGELILSPEVSKELEDTLGDAIPNYAGGGIPGEGEVDDNETNKNNPSLFDKIRERVSNKVEKVRYEFNNGRPFKYIRDNVGKWILDKSDSDTVESLKKTEEDNNEKKSLFKSLKDMPNNFIGGIRKLFNGDEDAEDKKNKKGILGKLFNVFGGGKNPLKGIIGSSIGAIIGIPILTTMFKKFFGETNIGHTIKDELDGLVQNLNLGENLGDLGSKVVGGIVGWLRGENGAIGGGLPGLISAAVDHWATGFEFIATEIAPKAVEILVAALPSILKGALLGLGKIIGINFHNAIHGGEGSNNLMQKDKNAGANGKITIGKISSKNGSHKFNYNGKTYGSSDWNSIVKTDSNLNGTISANWDDLTSKFTTSSSNVIKKVEDKTIVSKANFIHRMKDRSGFSSYRDTESYKSLSKGMRMKLNNQIDELTKEGKNVVQVNIGTEENPKYVYKTLQDLLTMDNVALGEGVDENGNPITLSGVDILNNPSLGKSLGLDWQLTDEERQANKEAAGYAKNSSILGATGKVTAKKFLTGNTSHTMFRTLGKGAKHIPLLGRVAAPALHGADAVATGAGKLGVKVMPKWLTGNAVSSGKDIAKNAATSSMDDAAELWASHFANTGSKTASKAMLDSGDTIAKAATKNAGENAATKAVKKATEEGIEKAAKNSAKSSKNSLINTAINFFKNNFKKLAECGPLKGAVGKALKQIGKKCSKKAIQEATEKLIKTIEKKISSKFLQIIAKSSAKALGKIAAKVASGGIIGIIFDGAAFIHGFTQAETVLGVINDNSIVDYDPSLTTKLLCGLACLASEIFTCGLFPVDMFFDIAFPIVTDFFGLSSDGIDKLKDAREKSQEFLEEDNLANDMNRTVQEWNDKDKLSTKIKNGFGNFFMGKKDKETGEREGGVFTNIKNTIFGDKREKEVSQYKIDDVAKTISPKELKEYNKKTKSNISMDEYAKKKALFQETYKNGDATVDNIIKADRLNSVKKKGMVGVAKDAIGGIVDTGKSIGKGIGDVTSKVINAGAFAGKTIGSIVGNAWKYATYQSETKASDIAKQDTKNPLASMNTLFGGMMDTAFLPLRGIFTIGKGVAKIATSIIDFGKKFTKQVQNDMKQGVIDYNKGDLKNYFRLNETEVDADGNEVHNPLSPFRTFVKGSTRILNFPGLLLMSLGKAVSKPIMAVINAAKGTFETVAKSAGNTIEIARTGTLGEYFNFAEGGADTDIGWLNTVANAGTRIMLSPIAAVIGTGRMIKNGVDCLIEGIKMTIKSIQDNASQTLEIARNGSIKEYFNFTNGDSKDLPFSWLNNVMTGATRIIMLPAAAGVAVGSTLKKGMDSLLTGTKSFALDIAKDTEYINSYLSKKNLDGYWKQPYKSEGITGVIGGILGTVSRLIHLIPITIVQIATKIKDTLAKPVNWVKEKVGGFADGIAEFFGTKSDKNGKNKNGQTSALGQGGSGSGIKSKLEEINARGAKATSDPKFKNDPSFVSQIDSRYANKSFNVSGDSKKQTLADTGCGPAAAAMVVNNATQTNTLDMKNAARDALKFKVKNGGVNAAYFEDEFSKHGLSTKYITDENPAKKNQEILSNLYSGNRTVLMGKDASNRSKANSPYGPNDHYIVATRVSKDGKYIWVNDPESKTPEIKYKTSTILNNTKMGVAGIAASGSGLLGVIHARGSKINTRKFKSYNACGTFGPDTVEYKVWNGLRAAGYDEIHTAAVMGNLYQESRFDPAVVEKSNGVGFGLVQWSKGRRTAIENYAASIGKSPSDLVNVQIPFLIAEMTPGGGCNGYAAYEFMTQTKAGQTWAADSFQKATDLDTATRAFCWTFERPSERYAMIDVRLEQAKKYYEAFTGSTVDMSLSSGTNATAINTSSTSNSSSTSQGGTILDKIFGAVGNFAKAFGLASIDSSSQPESTTSSSGVLSGAVSEKQQALVDKMKSIEGQIDYSQTGPRNPDAGSADCSSTVSWAYKKVLGDAADPGDWSGAYPESPNTYTVTEQLDPSVMQPGDAIVYNGHVEMYAGNNQMIGHGGPGKGPTTKPLSDKKGRFRMVRRWNGFKDMVPLNSEDETLVGEENNNTENTPESNNHDDRGFKKNTSHDDRGFAAGSGSDLIDHIHAKGAGLNPSKNIPISDTMVTSDDSHSDKRGFLRKSRYDKSLKKDIKVPASYYAAGSDVENTNKSANRFKVSSKSNIIHQGTATKKDDKLTAYMNTIIKLLTKEVENTSMLSTVVAILTELVKVYEEERSITGNNKQEIQQKKDALESKRTSMLNILKATGIQSGNQNNDLTSLIKDAERLARI